MLPRTPGLKTLGFLFIRIMETENKNFDEKVNYELTQEQFEQLMFEKFERVKALFLAQQNIIRLDTDE